jgi:hypothetical protein
MSKNFAVLHSNVLTVKYARFEVFTIVNMKIVFFEVYETTRYHILEVQSTVNYILTSQQTMIKYSELMKMKHRSHSLKVKHQVA